MKTLKLLLVLSIRASFFLLAGCAQTYWNDVTGQGRGQSQFVIDNGYCRLIAQGANNQQQQLVNEQNQNGCTGTARQCGGLGALQGLTVIAASEGAYSACMNSRGWIEGAAPQSNISPGTGKGVLTWPNGDKYDGEYKNNRPDGRGRATFANVKTYDGYFSNGNMEGSGTFTWPDGQVFVGEYVKNMRNGQGSLKLSDGRSYVGGWKDDKFDGVGVYTWPNGQRYAGSWKNGVYSGTGTLTLANGLVQAGSFEAGRYISTNSPRPSAESLVNGSWFGTTKTKDTGVASAGEMRFLDEHKFTYVSEFGADFKGSVEVSGRTMVGVGKMIVPYEYAGHKINSFPDGTREAIVTFKGSFVSDTNLQGTFEGGGLSGTFDFRKQK